jgi:DNA polymerase-1
MESEIRALTELPELNINSDQQLRIYFFGPGLDGKGPEKSNYASAPKGRYAPVEWTDGGATKRGPKRASTAASVLEALRDQHNDHVARLILEHRTRQKILSTYLHPLPKLLGPDARVHTTFEQHRTTNQRLASRDPNLQNIPTRNELGRRVRQMFIAADGWSLIVADYSQMELRILAYVTQDPALLQACHSGEDLHTAIARTIFHIPADEPVPKSKRSTAKNCQFAIAYGASAQQVAAMSGISIGEADAIIRKWFATFKTVAPWRRSIEELGRDQGYAVNLFGGRRHTPELLGVPLEHGDDRIGNVRRSLVNAMISGPASHFTCMNGLVRMSEMFKRAGTRARLLSQIHDCVIVEVPDEEIERMRPLIERTLLQPISPVEVPIAIDMKVVKCWETVDD